MAKSKNVTEDGTPLSTPQLDVENAKNVVRYFENIRKAHEEIGKLIDFNLKEAREQQRQLERRLEQDPAQVELKLAE
ncbi:MAG: hypothetical protein [Wigfec virus K19_165]|nr:MAG: hypothetical protein [Wigfec virus K19_165]